MAFRAPSPFDTIFRTNKILSLMPIFEQGIAMYDNDTEELGRRAFGMGVYKICGLFLMI